MRDFRKLWLIFATLAFLGAVPLGASADGKTKRQTAGKARAKNKGGGGWKWAVAFLVIGGAGGGYYFWRKKQKHAGGADASAADDDGDGFSFEKVKRKAKAAGLAAKEVASKAASTVAEVAKDAGNELVGNPNAPEAPVAPAAAAAPVAAVASAAPAAAPAAATPIAAATAASVVNPYPPVHGIDVKTYAKINMQRNTRFAFDDASIQPILAPYGISPAQFAEVDQTWQERMADGTQDPHVLAKVVDEFNQASAAAMQAPAAA